GMQEMLDAVVVVDTPLGHRMQWIQERNHLTVAEATKRIDSQMPVEQKVARADYVLLNNGSLIDLSRKVDELHLWLLAKEKSSS
ncbi:MAG: dephospho-CoA kinase, partial [Caldithrix sp.]